MKKQVKKFEALVLVLTMVLTLVPAGIPDAEAVFSPRATVPDYGTYASGNPFPYSNGNCTWYAWARIREIFGVNLPFRGNANSWYSGGGGYTRSTTPKVGAVACWGGALTLFGMIYSPFPSISRFI